MKLDKLCKGVSLFYHQTNQFKTSTLSLNIITPLNEHASENACLINLLARTTKKLPTVFEMNKALAFLYGTHIWSSVRKNGESLVLSLNMSFLEDRFTLDSNGIFEQCAKLLLSCFFEPNVSIDGFSKSDVEREKRLLLESLKSEKDDKRQYALNRMIEEMCCDEAYAMHRFGSEKLIEKITPLSLLQRWKKLVLNCPVQINYIGSVAEETITRTVKPYFEKFNKDELIDIRTEFLTESYGEKVVTEKQKVKQSKIAIGYRAGMTFPLDNLAAITLMNSIFGAGTHSKLFLNVREKMSLCYYCSARLLNSKGIITVQAGVEKDNIQKAVAAIDTELAEVQRGNFSNETIEKAKLSLCDGLYSISDSEQSIDSWAKSICTSGTFYTPEQLADKIKNVSREEIIVAASMITKDTVFILEAETEGTENE